MNRLGLAVLILFLLVIPQYYVRPTNAQQDLVPVSNATIELMHQDGSELTVTTDGQGVFSGLVRTGTYQYIRISGPTIQPYTDMNVVIDQGNNVLEYVVQRSPWMVGNVTVDGDIGRGIVIQSANVQSISDSNGRFAFPLAGRMRHNMSFMHHMMFSEFSDYERIFNNLTGLHLLYPQLTMMEMPKIISRGAPPAVMVESSFDFTGQWGNEVINRNVAMSRSGTVQGLVTDGQGRPVANAIINIFSTRPGTLYSAYAVTDSQGRFSVSINIVPGEEYAIQAVAEGYAFYNTTFIASENVNLNIQLDVSVVIKGRVTDGEGRPLSNILVNVVGERGWVSYALTDSNGYYEVGTGFSPGENVSISYGYRSMWPSLIPYGFKFTNVILSPGVNTIDLVYDIKTVMIQGVVNDIDRGGLLELVSIEIIPHTNISLPYPLPTIYVAVSRNGSFSVRLPTAITFFDFTIYITSVDIGIKGVYYYPDSIVAQGLSTDQDIDLGVIQIASYPLIQVTIKVYTQRSTVELPDFYHSMEIIYSNMSFQMSLSTNSSLQYLSAFVAPNNGTIYLSVVGPTGTNGYLLITIPKVFLGPPYSIYIDGVQATYDVASENATHITLEIWYHHSTRNIVITSTSVIPEFPLDIVALGIMVLAALIFSYVLRRFSTA